LTPLPSYEETPLCDPDPLPRMSLTTPPGLYRRYDRIRDVTAPQAGQRRIVARADVDLQDRVARLRTSNLPDRSQARYETSTRSSVIRVATHRTIDLPNQMRGPEPQSEPASHTVRTVGRDIDDHPEPQPTTKSNCPYNPLRSSPPPTSVTAQWKRLIARIEPTVPRMPTPTTTGAGAPWL